MSYHLGNCQASFCWSNLLKYHQLDSNIIKFHSNPHIPYMGNIWGGKILADDTGKSYWRGKVWRISYSQCICKMHFQCVSGNIDEENFGE